MLRPVKFEKNYWLEYDNTTLRSLALQNKDYSMIQKMWKVVSTYVYLLLYTNVLRPRLSIPMKMLERLKSK